jgi:hypothetical protein
MECPACSHPHSTPTRIVGVEECCLCGALHGECYRGDSYRLVEPRMTTEQVPPERLRYYDFMVVGSDGLSRRHGWFDTETRLIVQIG